MDILIISNSAFKAVLAIPPMDVVTSEIVTKSPSSAPWADDFTSTLADPVSVVNVVVREAVDLIGVISKIFPDR